MDNLSRRHNLVPFFLVLVLGISISLYLPQYFLTANIEIPAFALIAGELAIALIASVLSFENISSSALIKLAIWILAVSTLDAVLCFFVQQGSTMSLLPAATLKLNWIQLLIFNLTGIGTTFSLYTTVSSMIRTATPQETMIDNRDKQLVSSSTNQDIDLLNKTMSYLETDFSIKAPNFADKISLEALLTEDSATSPTSDTGGTSSNLSPESSPQETIKNLASLPIPNTGERLLQDVSGELEDIFSQIAPQEKQDFSARPDKNSASSMLQKEDATSAQNNTNIEILNTEELIFGPRISNSKQTSIKEFGKLSTNTKSTAGEPTGTLKSIGQMLLDTKAIENIIRKDSDMFNKKWQIISIDKAANMQAIMDNLSALPGVESSLIIGRDGMLLANTENLATQKYILGPLSLAIHNTVSMSSSKLQIGQLQQAVLRCSDKVTILTDIGVGLLAVFSAWDNDNIDLLIECIDKAALLQNTVASPQVLNAKKPDLTTKPFEEAHKQNTSTTPAKEPLITVSDEEITNIFNNITSDNSSNKTVPAVNIESKSATINSPGPLNVSASEISDLFDNLLTEDKKDDISPLISSPIQKEFKAPSELKEFGKLSASSASKQNSDTPEGTMKTIGRQLIDVQAIENIIKTGENINKTGKSHTTTKIISAAHGEGIQSLLKTVDACSCVIGSVVVGYDGFVIASTLQQIDRDMVGAMCTGMYSHIDVATKKLGKGNLKQAVFFSKENRITILTSLVVGILIIFVDQGNLDQLDTLIKTIEATVHTTKGSI